MKDSGLPAAGEWRRGHGPGGSRKKEKNVVLKQIAILLSCLALGHLVVWAVGVSFPGSIVGMLLMAAALQMGIIKLESVKGISDVLISNMSLFFVPNGVGLMLYFDIIKAEFWPIVIATLVSTVVVFVATGWCYQGVRRIRLMRVIRMRRTRTSIQ